MSRAPRLSTRAMRGLGSARSNMAVIAISYGIYALSLIFQGQRWGRTPAYHNLLLIMPQAAWGACFALTTVLLAAGIRWPEPRRLSVAALTAAFIITLAWTLAFVVRWATSGSTTPETWVSWAVNAYLLAAAAVRLDLQEVLVPSRREGGDDAG